MKEPLVINFDMENRDNFSNLADNFYEKGIHLYENWLSGSTLGSLNEELDYYFSDVSINSSIRSQYYDRFTKIFDQTQFLQSVNFLELMVDIAEQWKKIYPHFDQENYILSRATIKNEEGSDGPILWHTDQKLGMFRNIIYLKGGDKDSGQFRFMVGSHREEHDIEFAMSKKEMEDRQHLIHDCSAPAGSALFFDAKGFHSNYNRTKCRRVILLTWSPRESDWGSSRILISSSNLTPKVLNSIKYFVNPGFDEYYKHISAPKDFDFNPDRPLPVKKSFKYFVESFNYHIIIQIKIKLKSMLDRVRGVKPKYLGSFRPE